MKKAQMLGQNRKVKISRWLGQDTEDDDFLMGKTPCNLSDSWEEEE